MRHFVTVFTWFETTILYFQMTEQNPLKDSKIVFSRAVHICSINHFSCVQEALHSLPFIFV